jgi:hypothetical protein
MTVGGTELANIDDVEGEARAIADAVESLNATIQELKTWAQALPDRWSGTDWGTRGLDDAIGGTAEAADALRGADALLEQLAAIQSECARARTVGESANEVDATGNLDAFRAA